MCRFLILQTNTEAHSTALAHFIALLLDTMYNLFKSLISLLFKWFSFLLDGYYDISLDALIQDTKFA